MSEGTRARGRLTPAPFAIPRDGGSIPPISTTWPLQVAVQGRAVVTVVSRWPASVVAVVLLVSISPRHRVRCAKKFALRARNTPNLTFLRLLGEFCRGLSGGGAVPGEFCRVCWPSTVTVPGPGPPLPLPATLYRLRGQTIRCRRRLLHGDGGGFCTTRSLLTACRRRVEPSCSAIPPDWRRGGRIRRTYSNAPPEAGRGVTQVGPIPSQATRRGTWQ